MRYWWVNQNQTYKHELAGGYLWSPKRRSDGARNPSYESMREVSPGDLIFSFKKRYIPSLGIAQSYCYECRKPTEFGTAGEYWETVGWMVDVHYTKISNPIRPKDHIETLRPLLPGKYSPLQMNGNGNQNIYLTELNPDLANKLLQLSGLDPSAIRIEDEIPDYKEKTDSQNQWENQIEQNIQNDSALIDTERSALVMARRGQGRFKSNVALIETQCRVTQVNRIEHLRASHLKPWRDSNNTERLNGENGLLLTPTIDHLFDRGFITFENNGLLTVSPVAHKPSLEKMGIPITTTLNVGSFTEGQKRFLDFHRENVFLERS